MEETFYEMLERTRAIDRALFWLALLCPLTVAGFATLLRTNPVVRDQRHRWVLALLAAPALLVMWKIYNAVVDHFGLDSVAGLIANASIFAAAALIVAALRMVLKVAFAAVPLDEKADAIAKQDLTETKAPAAEFRPYKPGLSDESELPTVALPPVKARAGDWGRKDAESE